MLQLGSQLPFILAKQGLFCTGSALWDIRLHVHCFCDAGAAPVVQPLQ